ncbi:MAG: hypothetical protein OEV92_11240, partial [Nitrospinota bacterium]|nr:hypothetical protein [Nitrospinota bacterium]
MKRSKLSVGNFLAFLAAAALFIPAAIKAQPEVELSAEAPKLILAGGFEDDLPAKKEADVARQTTVSRQESQRLKTGMDMAKPSQASAVTETSMETPNSDAVESMLERVPLTEGVDMTTEALDEGFFKDIARQENLTFQELFETAGSLQEKTDSIAEIIDGEPSNQITFSQEDIIYINKGSANGITKGQKFGILKVGADRVYHP